MKTQIVHSEEFNKHNNMSHPENSQRIVVMLDELKKTNFYDKIVFIKPEILSEDLLKEVHSWQMIERIIEMSKEIEVVANQTVTVDFSLQEAVLTGETVQVYGELSRGQAKALQRQKTAQNIIQVVDEEFFGRFPDRNAAETVRRLPAISISSSLKSRCKIDPVSASVKLIVVTGLNGLG